ncbi:MAG: hypothetical protein IKK46_00900 [Clostridia bacterium]|nr:hypothetical protein [Clostridia bacterium]
MEEIKRIINNIDFEGLENVLVGNMLHYILGVKNKKAIFSLVSACFFTSYNFSVQGNVKTLCFTASGENERKDQAIAFKNVVNLIDDRIIMMPEKKRVSLVGLKNVMKILHWNKKLKQIPIGITERIVLLNSMFRAYITYELFDINKRKNSWKIKNLVTFCDVLTTDYLFLSKLKNECNITVTLQHGAYPISSNKWAYYGSKSDVFLVDSQHSADCALLSGYKGKTIVVGSMHNIDRCFYERKTNEKDVIGVFCNSEMHPREDNIEMIRVVEAFCRKTEKKAFIKLHPTNKIAEFQQIIDKDISTICEKGKSIDDFVEEISIAVIGVSTVFTNMLTKHIPAFLFFREGFDQNLYLNSDDVKFSTVSQLETLISKIGTNELNAVIDKYRDYFLVEGDIKGNYERVFKEIGINNDK